MKPSFDREAELTCVELRRKRLQLIPDPMELAKLAAALCPKLAAGNTKEQQKAISVARALFDHAVESAERSTAAEIARASISTISAAKTSEALKQDASGPPSVFSSENDYEKLREYLKTRHVPPPKSFRLGCWDEFMHEHQRNIRATKKFVVTREAVDAEVDRIKAKDAERKAAERRKATTNV